MIKKHHSFKYLISKLKQIYFQVSNPEDPWLTPLSIIILNQLIRKTDIGLEFGSGRSTIWLAKRCSNLSSVEHNQKWYEWTKSKLVDVKNVDYYLGALDLQESDKSDYLSIVKKSENESLDFVLNDGKLRDLVSLHVLDKLKSGGILIIDNAERYLSNSFDLPESIGFNPDNITTNWKIFSMKTQDWRKLWFSDGISSTLIIFKP